MIKEPARRYCPKCKCWTKAFSSLGYHARCGAKTLLPTHRDIPTKR